MITTVTLNPAVDKTIEIHGFKPGTVNRILGTRIEAGGKGINVSKVLKSLGASTLSTGFAGGESGRWINQWLKDKGIETDFVWVDQETRTNIKIIDTETSIITDINDKGKRIEKIYLKGLYDLVEKWAEKSKVMVFAGSIPDGLSNSIYTHLIEIASNKGCKTILDTEGEQLLQGIYAKPYMIKPNIDELESSLKVKINNENDIINHCEGFIEKGIQFVVVSMGAEGAVFVSKKNVLRAESVPVEVKSTVGAGDSMVAAFAYGMMKDYPLEETFKLAVAAATLSVKKGTTLHAIHEIENFKEKVNVKKLR
ncbi:1-phosphofructokinase [Clostridium formicaceticum]|uniref:Tagatose-6-phosphate kinase n=1 Tax=Clostridium formicaceticum TaxID=1497 RepID=A0AAC9RHC1_9CLOT|nr:1-phosphofructokinase [Clostridium formicaceticum]AOY76570.1 1-phosphofructokinase [Clostridium formicaceticum]ARE86989.1 Tagatose-6-phosphate kinase [Clostridium formicaceticum]